MHNRILRNLLPHVGALPVAVLMNEQTREYIRFSAELLGGIELFDSIAPEALDLFVEPKHTSEELKNALFKRPLRLPRIAVVITTRCTLRCPHCAHLNSQYKMRCDYKASKIIDAVRSVLKICDVDFITLLGGEPLLHPGLPEMIYALRSEPRLGRIGITTNGTLQASESLLTALSHPKTCVFISNYDTVLAPHTLELVDTLAKRGISVSLADSAHQWADAGGIEPRGRDAAVLRGMYSRCLFASCPVILDGKLYMCPRHANAANLGLVPKYEIGGVELCIEDTSVLKERIIEEVYARELAFSCNLCDFIAQDGSQVLIDRAT